MDILLAADREGEFLHAAVRRVLDEHAELPHRDRAFVKRVSAGVMEHLIELDYIADQFSNTKVRKMKPVIRAIIRSGIYQIMYMDAVPDPAACDEAVRLAKSRGLGGLSGFVNGVLRAVARNKAGIVWPDGEAEPILALSVKYSMPEWIVNRFINQYGRAKCEDILAAYQGERPVWVRVDARCSVSKVTVSLKKQGITVTPHPDIPCALAIGGYDSLTSIVQFTDGTLYVQNPSSMLVALAADPAPGEFIVDVCAAPGGKAIHAAQLLEAAENSCDMIKSEIDEDKALVLRDPETGEESCGQAGAAKKRGFVLARDLSESKVRLINENMSRCHITNMTAQVRDATVPDPDLAGMADTVIADLPCSGLGVMGGKPDIRYRVSPDDVASLAALQREILNVVSAYVKPGGTLIYSTCTMTPEENQDNARMFAETHPDFALSQEQEFLPDAWYDGFYIAKFKRSI